VHDVLRSPGQPLDAETRTSTEATFGHDFSQVRIHSDTKAGESARAMQAQAYTVESSVVFGAGQYALQTHSGKHLLAPRSYGSRRSPPVLTTGLLAED
jgi:hypothetical protein